jgi:quercetin dioxygenase-like cupin family protein
MTLLDDLKRRLEGETGAGHSWSNGPGDRYAPHSHPYEKVLYCVEGSITFHVAQGGRSVELAPGDRLVLPAGTIHSAVVGSGGCLCIEGHR